MYQGDEFAAREVQARGMGSRPDSTTWRQKAISICSVSGSAALTTGISQDLEEEFQTQTWGLSFPFPNAPMPSYPIPNLLRILCVFLIPKALWHAAPGHAPIVTPKQAFDEALPPPDAMNLRRASIAPPTENDTATPSAPSTAPKTKKPMTQFPTKVAKRSCRNLYLWGHMVVLRLLQATKLQSPSRQNPV